MHCISLPPPPRQNTISAIFCHLVCFLSPADASIIQFFYVSSNFKGVQCILFTSIIGQNSRHYKTSYPGSSTRRSYVKDPGYEAGHYKDLRFFCQIYVMSSTSCVFKLQNPIVLHSNIRIEKEKFRPIFSLKITHDTFRTMRA